MSKIICSAAIRGAHKIVERAEQKLAEAIEAKGEDCKVEFPNTGYYLPVIYGMTGEGVETLGQMKPILERARGLLPPVPADKTWVPYLGHALDAGMATLWAEEIIEGCKYVVGPNPVDGIWLGAADDVILRERGIEFVDGTAPGFAACVGACETNELAVSLARELQQKSLYVFMSADTNGKSMSEQLAEEGVQMGWETRLVPFGKSIEATIYAAGFATRAALSFGGVQPGDFARNLRYNKLRIFAFVLALGEVDDEKYANAAGAINYGFPTVANTDIPEILPTGVCTYEHVVSNIPTEDMVEKAIEVRGLKIKISEVDVPVPFGPAFEGERIRKDDMFTEMGGTKTPAFEFVTTKSTHEIQDGNVEVIGPEITDINEGDRLPLGIIVEVAGRKMQTDFEPILERQVHRFLNEAQGIFHMGQRDITWVRISKDGKAAGLTFRHLGVILHAKLHDEYGAIFDKVQVKVYTNEEDVLRLREEARTIFHERDARLAGMTDESVELFYSCTLCQSFAPNHVCVITPERPGLCGAYNWLDGRAAYEITPTGPNQPLEKGRVLDPKLGQWEKINDFVKANSHGTLEGFSAYSMMIDPMTSCGCFECISIMLAAANGIMTVDRDHPDMTPCGMKFSTLAGTVGGGLQTPGFIGHSKQYIGSKKFISADGGMARICWMPKRLKEELKDMIEARAEELGLEDFYNKIADETIGSTEEEIAEFCAKVNHPALGMDPMF
ncbi:MAG: CO dehydrogenase/CO-methylating acetyl-CoA synthase complex subunit beta [Planctomycetes bacterium]|nr:CO dehydrogenase/CO-methylating acetyl-CoA synthase complex subunit beta [Planctomycetota bacterium]